MTDDLEDDPFANGILIVILIIMLAIIPLLLDYAARKDFIFLIPAFIHIIASAGIIWRFNFKWKNLVIFPAVIMKKIITTLHLDLGLFSLSERLYDKLVIDTKTSEEKDNK